MMQRARAEDMAAMDGYCKLLRRWGHKVDVLDMSGVEMKETRLKAARYIYQQRKKDGYVQEGEPFDSAVVYLDDIDDNRRYYAGLLFVPSISEHICKFGRRTATADAAHCAGVGPQSYGTAFEVLAYDANNSAVPILFFHSVGVESEETWLTVFKALKDIPGYDVEGRITIVDQEKSIDSTYRSTMQHAKLFLDMLHVKKNMSKTLGAERAAGILKYENAVRAPSRCLLYTSPSPRDQRGSRMPSSA